MYQAFYNLTGKPFRLSPDPAFFFPSRGHKRALAYLRYGLNQDEGFVVITGAPGTGKTTLAKILLQEMGETNIVVAHLTTTQLEADDMLRMVAASFGLRYEGLDKTGLLKSLEAFLLARARERKKALLVIDEAQNLPPRSLEELRMLSNLQVGDRSLLQIFLLGQEQFRQMLDEVSLEQLKQRIIANYHLSPLGADESQRYVESRLQQVGWDSDPHFAEIAFEMIHEYTAGVPRRINMLCDRILLFGCMEEIHSITSEVVKLVTKELDEEVTGKITEEEDRELDLGEQKPAVKAAKPQATPQPAQAPASTANVPQAQSDSAPKTPDQAVANAPAKEYSRRMDEENLDIEFAAFSSELDERLPAEPASNRDKRADKLRLKTNLPLEKKGDAQKDDDKRVMGNTVQKKKPADRPAGGNSAPGPIEISERDLFRVIPGGRPADQIAPAGQRIAAQARSGVSSPSNEDVKLRRILRLVLAFHRSPSRFPGLDNPDQPLPEGITELLELAISEDDVLNKVSPAAVMGISPVMLRAAVRFFVRRAMFIINGDHYRVLGVPPTAPQALIEKHYDLLMRLLRQDKQRGSAESVTRVGQAYEALSRTENSAFKFANLDRQEDEEMVIDFDSLEGQHARESGFGAKPNEMFNPQLGISRKRMRYASQAAVLGFGVLVVVLGLYIVQLEPGDTSTAQKQAMVDKKVVLPATTEPKVADSTQSERRNLQFSDGTPSSSTGSKETVSDNTTLQFSQDEIDAIRKELLGAVKEQEIRLKPDAEKDRTTPAQTNASVDLNKATETKPAVVENAPVQTQTATREPAPQSTQFIEPKPATDTVMAETETASPVETLAIQTESPLQTAPRTTTRRSSRSSFAEAASRSAASSRIVQGLSDEEKRAIAAAARATASAAAPRDMASPATEAPTTEAPTTDEPTTEAPPTVAVVGGDSGLAPAQVSQPAVSDQSQSAPVSGSAAATISQDELFDVVGGLINGYETGNVDKLMSFFDSAARTNNRIDAKGIRADYEELFSASSARKLRISGLNWEIEADGARAVGDYEARINPINSRNGQSFKGNITLQVRKHDDGVKITRLYFSNQTVSTTERLSENAAVAVKTTAPAMTREALQSMLNNFVAAYAEGDLERLMTLFAKNAQTNDQNTLAGIRNDHSELFKSTAVREISIKSVKWTLRESDATGEGWFQVKLRPHGSDQVSTVKGRIRISAKNTGKGAHITQMFHSAEQ
ncbi:MAG: XrtA-associated ATPase [Gammaproteobacteria bacterium]|nr:XrtA-associated ATPase [Gammaproteobacteria bacterium]MDH5799258.1 XrtA-associated ATPase [Gammaproteobacteria bacterium]